MTARGPGPGQALVKRAFDLLLAVPLCVVLAPLMAACWVVATVSTRRNGLFTQERVGKDAVRFHVMKIRTMRSTGGTTVTTRGDARVTRAGSLMRAWKLDELPQLLNVVRGEMSLVGPRPDVPGWADALEGPDRVLLTVRPGITSPATIAFRHEEALLAQAPDAEAYNREVLWPAKVRVNREYVENWSMRQDLRCLADTVRSVLTRDEGVEGP